MGSLRSLVVFASLDGWRLTSGQVSFTAFRLSRVGGSPMSRILQDQEIQALLQERKVLPRNWESRLKPTYREDEAYGRRAYQLEGDQQSRFRIHVRDNKLSVFDFSLILVYVDHDDSDYILTRFNGKHPSQHTNKWEAKRGLPNARFRNVFHIHTATERYQQDGLAIDGFAEPTTAYASFDSALRAFVRNSGFVIEGQENRPTPLFDNEPD